MRIIGSQPRAPWRLIPVAGDATRTCLAPLPEDLSAGRVRDRCTVARARKQSTDPVGEVESLRMAIGTIGHTPTRSGIEPRARSKAIADLIEFAHGAVTCLQMPEGVEPEIIASTVLVHCRRFLERDVPGASVDPLAGAVVELWTRRLAAYEEKHAEATRREAVDLDDALTRGILRDVLITLRVTNEECKNLLRGPAKAAERRKQTWQLVDFVAARGLPRDRERLPRLHREYVAFCKQRNREPLNSRAFAAEIGKCGGVERFRSTAPGRKRPTAFRRVEPAS